MNVTAVVQPGDSFEGLEKLRNTLLIILAIKILLINHQISDDSSILLLILRHWLSFAQVSLGRITLSVRFLDFQRLLSYDNATRCDCLALVTNDDRAEKLNLQGFLWILHLPLFVFIILNLHQLVDILESNEHLISVLFRYKYLCLIVGIIQYLQQFSFTILNNSAAIFLLPLNRYVFKSDAFFNIFFQVGLEIIEQIISRFCIIIFILAQKLFNK